MLWNTELGSARATRLADPKQLRRVAGLSLLGLAVALIALSPSLRAELSGLVGLIAGGRVDILSERLASYGAWGPFVSLGVMVVQGILAPLPAFVVTFANGLAFGALWGWVLSLAGHVLASSICFALARRFGRGPIEGLISRRGLEAADGWLGRWGPHAVLLTRLAPGISFDAISYAAGLTSIGFRRFLIATAVGVVPETFLFAYLGHAAHRHATLVLGISVALCLAGMGAAFLILRARRKTY